ncbi:MAG: hypothetical protein ACJ746_29785 [Bryobacteraceae bacterium]
MRCNAQAISMQATVQHSCLRRCCSNGSVFPSLSVWFALLIMAGALLSAPRRLAASDGRDFAGSYQLTDIFDQGDTFVATFTTRVFNYSDADVSEATVVLDSRVVPGQTYWSFSSVSIANRWSVRLRCVIKIPKAEYNTWQQGARPNLHLDTANDDGTSLRRTVELTRNLSGEEK